jgi:hypothetical protein
MPKLKNFAFLMYEDSLNPDWQEKLTGTGLQFWWIKHDKDVKKSHYHVYVHADNPISEKTVQDICANCGAANKTYKKIISQVGYLRYLIHMDNPEKYQYNVTEVHCANGARYSIREISRKSENESNDFDVIQEMIDYIDSNGVYLYCDFVRYCLAFRRDWFKILVSSHGRIIDKYIKSFYWAMRQTDT